MERKEFLITKGKGKNKYEQVYAVTEDKDLHTLGMFLIYGYTVKEIKNPLKSR